MGVDNDGKIQYLNATIVEDDGCSHNENILSYTIGAFPNCYDDQYFDVTSAAVLTDLPANSYMRGPGTLYLCIIFNFVLKIEWYILSWCTLTLGKYAAFINFLSNISYKHIT